MPNERRGPGAGGSLRAGAAPGLHRSRPGDLRAVPLPWAALPPHARCSASGEEKVKRPRVPGAREPRVGGGRPARSERRLSPDASRPRGARAWQPQGALPPPRRLRLGSAAAPGREPARPGWARLDGAGLGPARPSGDAPPPAPFTGPAAGGHHLPGTPLIPAGLPPVPQPLPGQRGRGSRGSCSPPSSTGTARVQPTAPLPAGLARPTRSAAKEATPSCASSHPPQGRDSPTPRWARAWPSQIPPALPARAPGRWPRAAHSKGTSTARHPHAPVSPGHRC